MITEDYVSFETARLLKEKGFDEPCQFLYFSKYKPEGDFVGNFNARKNSEINEASYSAPTLQRAMKWLREEKGVAIIPVLSSILDNEKFLWDIKIVVAKTGERYSQGWIYEKQEDAFDTAIKYCLKSLI